MPLPHMEPEDPPMRAFPVDEIVCITAPGREANQGAIAQLMMAIDMPFRFEMAERDTPGAMRRAELAAIRACHARKGERIMVLHDTARPTPSCTRGRLRELALFLESPRPWSMVAFGYSVLDPAIAWWRQMPAMAAYLGAPVAAEEPGVAFLEYAGWHGQPCAYVLSREGMEQMLAGDVRTGAGVYAMAPVLLGDSDRVGYWMTRLPVAGSGLGKRVGIAAGVGVLLLVVLMAMG